MPNKGPGASFYLEDEEATISAGKKLGELVKLGGIIYLEGTLGAGKTTFCRGVLNAFGYSGNVKSPTYTLVEPYDVSGAQVYHFDLYRLADPEELEYMGIRDYFTETAICLVEWPSKGVGVLPDADLVVKVEPKLPGRQLTVTSCSDRGNTVIHQLKTE